MIRRVILRSPSAEATLGCRDSLYRHQMRSYTPTAMAVEVPDHLSDEAVAERTKAIENLAVSRVGQELGVDVVAVRHTSADAERLAEAAAIVASASRKPLILCSLDVDALRGALETLSGHRPLIYAATKENWVEMANLAEKYDAPLAVAEPNLDLMEEIVHRLWSAGVDELVLDPGCNPKSRNWPSMELQSLVDARSRALSGAEEFAYPLMAVTAKAWLQTWPESPVEAAMAEACTAAVLMLRYADLLVLHASQTWALLPLLALRQGLFADPRRPPKVEPGLKAVGSPGVDAPVLVTTNYTQTYHLVRSDLERAGVDAYLLVVDTGGLSVRSALAGGQLNPKTIAKALKEAKAEKITKSRTLILPGHAKHLKSEVEQLTGWKAIIGPKDSIKIGQFVENLRNS